MYPNEPNYTPFGGIAIFFLIIIGGGLMAIRELSAFIGMPW